MRHAVDLNVLCIIQIISKKTETCKYTYVMYGVCSYKWGCVYASLVCLRLDETIKMNCVSFCGNQLHFDFKYLSQVFFSLK